MTSVPLSFAFKSTKDLHLDCVSLILHLNGDVLVAWPLPQGDPVDALELRVTELSRRSGMSKRDVRQDLMNITRTGLKRQQAALSA